MFIWVVNATLFIQQTFINFKTQGLLDRFSLEHFIPPVLSGDIWLFDLVSHTTGVSAFGYCHSLILFPYRLVFQILNTSKGYITVELYKDGSPEVVDRFLDLW